MDEELEQPGSPIELSEIKGIVRRRRWEFLVPFFIGWAVVWGASWLIPSTYRSGTLILVEQPSVPEKYVVSNIGADIQQQLDSITQQIMSRTRLVHIIDTLGLYAKDRKHMSDDDLVERMRKDIEIELVRGDEGKLSAFNIYYDSRDPAMAQATTRELAELFISENVAQRQKRSADTTSFLEDQLEQARQNLAKQEAKVRDFKDHHPGELPTQAQSNLQILAGLQNQMQADEDSLNRAKQQQTYIDSLLNQYRTLDRGTATTAADGGASELEVIDKQLDQLGAQLTDLLAHYTEKHPDVRKTKEQIARVEKTRARIIANMNGGTSSASAEPAAPVQAGPKSTAMLELESQQKANQLEIQNRQQETKELQAKIDQYQGRLNMAPVMEQQFADITRDYDQSKLDYETLLKKKNESEMATDLEKTEQGEHFRMLDPPNLPVKPSKPKRLMFLGAGLAVGLVLGGAMALGKEKLSGKIYSEREVKKLVPFEVIAEIPPIATLAEEWSTRRADWTAGAIALGMAGCILIGSAVTYLYG
ncbi:MAG: GNVR domain-containing protein [Terriglobales bacterium]|jgi:polysaccharide chain length determinant protein (PEP-CTERM system associated)